MSKIHTELEQELMMVQSPRYSGVSGEEILIEGTYLEVGQVADLNTLRINWRCRYRQEERSEREEEDGNLAHDGGQTRLARCQLRAMNASVIGKMTAAHFI